MGEKDQKEFYKIVKEALEKLDPTVKKQLDMSFLKSGVSGGEQLTSKTEKSY